MHDKLRVLLRPFALALLAVVPIAGSARADDLFPPSFRGTPLGVEGHWHVGDGTTFNPLNVHIYNRVVPNPSETVSPVTPTIVQDGLNYNVTFPDWIDQEPLKIGRIQLYWISSDPTVFPVMDPSVVTGTGITGFKGSGTDPGVIVNQGPVAGPIGGYFFDFQIQPNPDSELLTFTFLTGTGGPTTVQLQQVDIDTASVPEPTSIALLGLAGLLVFRRRQRPV